MCIILVAHELQKIFSITLTLILYMILLNLIKQVFFEIEDVDEVLTLMHYKVN